MGMTKYTPDPQIKDYTFTLTCFDMVLYVDSFFDLRYLRNALLLATFLSNDLLASKSFL